MSLQTKRSPLTTGSPKAAKPRRRVAFGAPPPTHNSRRARAVDLVDHRQEIIRPLALAPMISSTPIDSMPLELAAGQAPLDKPRHRAINAFPTGAKNPGPSPAKTAAAPSGKGSTSWRGSPAACPHPGHLLDHHAVFRAVDPPGRHSETTSRCPTAAQKARSAAATDHSPAPG